MARLPRGRFNQKALIEDAENQPPTSSPQKLPFGELRDEDMWVRRIVWLLTTAGSNGDAGAEWEIDLRALCGNRSLG